MCRGCDCPGVESLECHEALSKTWCCIRIMYKGIQNGITDEVFSFLCVYLSNSEISIIMWD